MYRIKQLLIIITLIASPFFSEAQGYGYVLFSSKGDTVLTRTSFGNLEKKDTITTFFVVYAKESNCTKKLSVFKVHEKETEKHSKGYACADYRLVPGDIIKKYDYRYIGSMINPKDCPLKIKSKINLVRDTVLNAEKVFKRQIEYAFKTKDEVILTEIVWDIVDKRRKPVEKPKITKVYYNKFIDKYFVEYMLVDNYIDKETNRKMTRHSMKEVIL